MLVYDASLMDEKELRLYAQDVRHDYHAKRDQLYHLIQQYYNQSITSNYIKEDDICKLIDECREYKKMYKKISAYIVDRTKSSTVNLGIDDVDTIEKSFDIFSQVRIRYTNGHR